MEQVHRPIDIIKYKKAPNKMTEDEFMSEVMPDVEKVRDQEGLEPATRKLFELVGMEAVRGGGHIAGFGIGNLEDSKHPLAKMMYKTVCSWLKPPMYYRIFGNIQRMAQYSNATCFDSFKRIADLGYSQVQVKFSKTDDPVYKEVSELIDESIKSGAPEGIKTVLTTQLGKPCIAVRDDKEKLVGLGRPQGCGIDYSVSGNLVKPLKFETFNAGIAYISQFAAKSIKVTKHDRTNALGSEKYIQKMQLNKYFDAPSESFQAIFLGISEFVKVMEPFIPLPKGSGIDLAQWFYRAITTACLPQYSDIATEALVGMIKEMDDSLSVAQKQNGASFGVVTRSDGKKILKINPPGYCCDYVTIDPEIVKSKQCSDETALSYMQTRRNIEGLGGNGISGQSLHYAWGIAAPKEVIDLITLATDIKPFVKVHSGSRICIKYPGKADDKKRIVMCLKALTLAGFEGEVSVANCDVSKILIENTPFKEKKILTYTKRGTFGRSKFELNEDAAGNDVPTWYVFNFDLNNCKSVQDYTNKFNDAYRAAGQNITAKDYMINTMLYGQGVSKNTVQSFEAHNMSGWIFTNPAIVQQIADHEALLAANQLDQMHFMPCTEKTKRYAYARCVVANLARATYVYHVKPMNAVFAWNDMFQQLPCRGNLSGMLSYNVMVHGVNIDAVINNREVLDEVLTNGTDEVKSLIRSRMASSGTTLPVRDSVQIMHGDVGGGGGQPAPAIMVQTSARLEDDFGGD